MKIVNKKFYSIWTHVLQMKNVFKLSEKTNCFEILKNSSLLKECQEFNGIFFSIWKEVIVITVNLQIMYSISSLSFYLHCILYLTMHYRLGFHSEIYTFRIVIKIYGVFNLLNINYLSFTFLES